MYAARVEDNASWGEIGVATQTLGDQARASFLDALDRREYVRLGSTQQYRNAL